MSANLGGMPRIQAANILEHKVLTRAMILERAHKLFADLGYQETTFGEIAAEMDIARTTIYQYFADKDDLVASLVEENLPLAAEKIVNQIPIHLSPTERLRRLVEHMVEFVVVEPTLGLLLHRDVHHLSAQAKKRVAAAHQLLVKIFADAYRAGVEAGDFKRMPTNVAGQYLNNTVALAAQAILGYDNPAEALKCATETVTHLLFNGLTTRNDRNRQKTSGFWKTISGIGVR